MPQLNDNSCKLQPKPRSFTRGLLLWAFTLAGVLVTIGLMTITGSHP